VNVSYLKGVIAFILHTISVCSGTWKILSCKLQQLLLGLEEL